VLRQTGSGMFQLDFVAERISFPVGVVALALSLASLFRGPSGRSLADEAVSI
jgi:hypothetical protein